MLYIVVCVKAVPDPKEACNIKIDPVTKTLLRCDVPLVMGQRDDGNGTLRCTGVIL